MRDVPLFIPNRSLMQSGPIFPPVYILAIPAFSFFLPLYSFWKMDDFSWGSTRLVMNESGQKIVIHVSLQMLFFAWAGKSDISVYNPGRRQI